MKDKEYLVKESELQLIMNELAEIPAKLSLRAIDTIRDIVAKGAFEPEKQEENN
jgi:hypothetical protein